MNNHYKKSLDNGNMTQELYDELRKILNKQEIESEKPKEDDLEWDLRGSEFIINKCKSSEDYSQNLYAAMCNNLFYKGDKEWSCSWRYAGGIVADLNEQGDYIDWYCSGIGSSSEKTKYVGESVVTDEIREDLLKLGWIVKPYTEEFL